MIYDRRSFRKNKRSHITISITITIIISTTTTTIIISTTNTTNITNTITTTITIEDASRGTAATFFLKNLVGIDFDVSSRL